MKTYEIDSIDSVKNFLYDIYTICQKEFDPAEDLKALTDEHGSPIFPKAEAEYLDNVMLECFIFCIHNKTSIYKVVNEVPVNLKKRTALAR